MKAAIIALISLILFPALGLGGEKEELFFKEKMIPLAQEFIKRNDLPTADFGTNNIKKWQVQFFTDGRQGCTANLKLKTGYFFDFYSNEPYTEISFFHDENTKTYYVLDSAPIEKIEAVRTLILKNKLNEKTALELAKKFFKLQGHKEEDFHPPEFLQSYWVGKDDLWGKLPYYEVKWYRKDVQMTDVHAGIATLPYVRIEVSGIDSHVISYSKGFMPVGSDF